MKWWDLLPQSLFFECWALSQFFSLSSFTLNKRLLSSSSFSAIRVVSPTYMRLLISLLAILIPACDSSSLPFHMMYTAYKLNKQGVNIQSWHTPNPNFEPVCCFMSSSVTSWPAYRFLRRQVRWSCIPISLRSFHSFLWSHSQRL